LTGFLPHAVRRNVACLFVLLCVMPVLAMAAPGEDVSPQAAEFFETHIRPLLVSKCSSCHGDKNPSGGLRLDSREEMLKGGGRGPAMAPGDANASLIVRAVRYDSALKMPPTGKLSDEEIAALEAWVKMGAPWPAAHSGGHTLPKGAFSDAQRTWWSFQPIKNPLLPKVKDAAWCRTPIDRFILAKLEAKGLQPAPAADRRTLIRRATFDLIGLPPTPEEVRSFLTDKSPNAYEKVVDRLLVDPRYGERWGRHWLDVARYADTKGYVFVDDPLFHNAYTYRDYVIDAFNQDKPYDQFVIEQLAADLLPQEADRHSLAALGYLTVGRRFLNDPVLINDDRIDVTCRGLMALTVGCARCHDHKFDPIPTKDYYSLYGVFASANAVDRPIGPATVTAAYEDAVKRIGDLQARRDALIQAQVARLRKLQMQSPAGLSAEVKQTLQGFGEGALPSDEQRMRLMPAFEPDAQTTLQSLKADLDAQEKHKPPTPTLAMAVQEGAPYDPHVFIRGNQGNQGAAVPRQFLQILSGPDRKPFSQGSGRLELARAIASRDNPLTARALVNRVWLYHFGFGLVRTPSDFGLRGERPSHPELLDWLAFHFAAKAESNASRSSSSFILHPSSFACAWSIKQLHRLILLSSVYRQSDAANPRASMLDPENRLLWRQNRQRLDLEALRDSLLAVAGQLDTTQGGPAVELTTAPYTRRRTVYGFIDRQNLQGLYRTFDFASPDTSSAQRYHTTVPQQALFMMNSPFVVEQTLQLERLPELQTVHDDSGRIRLLYSRLFSRAPTSTELTLGLGYLHQREAAGAEVTPLWQYGYGSYDPESQVSVQFTPFPWGTGSAWQASEKFPDPKLDYAMLTAEGGHPGSDARHAVIRRWTAPHDATVSVQGTLAHPSDKGDGVQARVISSRDGEIRHWIAFHSRVETQIAHVVVKQGDTLDFMVDCRTNPGYDAFSWAPIIRALPTQGVAPAALHAPEEWSAAAAFDAPAGARKPALTLWERYIQALLMTNEFSLVD
jgi:cytochrome c553